MRNTFRLFTLLLTLYTSSIFGQKHLDTDGLNNDNNMFLFALKEYCCTVDSTKTDVIYVRSETFIGEKWPQQIASFKIRYLSGYKDYKKAIKENNGSLTIVGFGNFEYKNGKFKIAIIPFSTTFSKRMVRFGNGGGLNVYFIYDCNENKFSYSEKEWVGI